MIPLPTTFMPELRRGIPTTVVAPKFKIGSSATTTFGETQAANMARIISKCGPQKIHRDYAGGSYTTFMTGSRNFDVDTVGLASIRETAISWNPLATTLLAENTPNPTTQFSGFNPTGLATYLSSGNVANLSSYGTETRANIDWLLSIPRYHDCLLIPWHEFDNNINTTPYGAGNKATLRAAYRIIFDMIHTFNNPHWQTGWLGQAYPWKGLSGSTSDPIDYWPGWDGDPLSGNNYVDVACVDVYNEGGLKGIYVAGGITKGPHWDSFGCSIGIPYSSERSGYQSRYGGTNGWKTTDKSGLTWTDGFIGWCEAIGVTKYFIGEVGTPLNYTASSPTWLTQANIGNDRVGWIKDAVDLLGSLAADPNRHAKPYGICYFENAGRNYSGVDYLNKTFYDATTLTVVTSLIDEVANSAALPISGVSIGDKYVLDSPKQIWRATATTPTWTVANTYIQASWFLDLDEVGSGMNGATAAWPAWAYAVTKYQVP